MRRWIVATGLEWESNLTKRVAVEKRAWHTASPLSVDKNWGHSWKALMEGFHWPSVRPSVVSSFLFSIPATYSHFNIHNYIQGFWRRPRGRVRWPASPPTWGQVWAKQIAKPIGFQASVLCRANLRLEAAPLPTPGWGAPETLKI